MRTFAQKPKASQQNKSVKSTHPARALSGQSRDVHSILQLQRTIGNQAVQGLLQLNAEKLQAGSATIVSTRFGHDSSRIPIFSPSPVQVQPKLTVSAPGGMYEQEADRVADQVMRMPEPHLKRSCACGGGCPRCQVAQQDQENQFVQSGHISANDAPETEVPRMVNEGVNSLGQPLDSATRAFFEPRFRRDFSQVRVHTNARAGDFARALNARAFTLGSNIVFGAELYEPETTRGRRLVAHELTHVVQQNQTAGQHIQRQENNEKDSRFQRVPPGPGAYTEDEYKAWLRRHPDSAFSLGGPWEPKSSYARYTPQWFSSRGYFYSGRMYGGYRGARIEVWLSNEGKGKEFRVFRRPEPATKKPPVETEQAIDPFVRDLEEAGEYVDDRTDQQRDLIRRAEELDGKIGTAEYDRLYAEYLNLEDQWRKEVEVNIERVKDLKEEAKDLDHDENLPEFEAIIKTLEDMQSNWPCGQEWGSRPDLPPTPLDRRRYSCIGQPGRTEFEPGKTYEF